MSYPFLAEHQLTHLFLTGRSRRSDRAAFLSYRAVESAFGAAGAVSGAVRGVRRAWSLRRRRRRAIAELMRLDDRLLRDIGILRADIPDLVRSAEAEPGRREAALRPPIDGGAPASKALDDLRLAA